MRDQGPAIEPGRGDGVTAGDIAALGARRHELAVGDMPTLGPVVHHANVSARCCWHNGRVFRYATTPDSARAYCRACVSLIMGDIRKGGA
jgi:hypothetical protein